MDFSEKRARSSFLSNRADFYEDMAAALDDKSDPVTELTNLRERAEKRKKTGQVKLYSRWVKGMDRGLMYNALKDDAPKTDLMIMSAFEQAGRLSEGLRFLSKVVTLAGNMRSAIQGAVITPIIVLIIISAILALHAFMLIPVLEQIIKPEDWPLPGKMLRPTALFIKEYGIYIAPMIVAALIGFKVSVTKWTGPRRVKFDNHLPYSIFRDYNGALFLTSLAALMKAGNGVLESLKQLESMSTPWMKWHIQQMIVRLDSNSAQPAIALDTGAIPRAVMDRIIDYGKRSSFVEAMNVIGLQSMARTEAKISQSAKVMNIIMMLFAGLLFVIVILGTVSTGLHAQDVIRASM
ncbi:MAG: hypothetical protein CTY35_00270 [Methylotenera sp.]|uniref:type II secretion system F family protein n=1 Tax=Methylotenera sp. TaxID=2051956 RepID=UPI000D43D6EB|nr:type II secretion system F family protein [Methylotenera sp.]PPC84790.1 MAG: hypothetical protein CTY38_00270 [Methylotenera sp.]PPD02149.1 MAG: hypothetical protein CTY35_00270 [Methylotenera sp.]